MGFRAALDRALFLLSVPKCVYCKERLEYSDLAFCRKCSAEFEKFKNRSCSLCARELHKCDCSMPRLERHGINRIFKVFRYIPREENRLPNSLIFALKQANRRDVVRRSADELMTAIGASETDFSGYTVTSIPRRRAAINKYGYDHSAALARELARRLGATYSPLLVSKARRAQKGLHGNERTKNTTYVIRRGATLKSDRVLIVDDVITTGASMSEASEHLKTLGAKTVVAATLSIAYKDPTVWFE